MTAHFRSTLQALGAEVPDSDLIRPSRTSQLVWWAGLTGAFAWIFADVLFTANNFLFRDAAHFYYPLFKFIGGEWAAGRVPLWNPLENIGAPLLATGTSSVFYPGKLLFALPISFDMAFKAYILGHLLLAACGAFRLARRWNCSVEAAALCGLSYAFGGNVMFQYCNVVFLVSAAWLPLAVEQADRLLAGRRMSSALWLGLIMALMILGGGDPQMVYHVGLLASGYAFLLWRLDRREKRDGNFIAAGESDSPSRWARFFHHRMALLAIAAAVACLLSAVQMIPLLELSRRSQRSLYQHPRSLVELAFDATDPEGAFRTGSPQRFDGLLGKAADPNSHAAQLYQFSVGPWRLVEYFWPGVSGRQFPQHRRWLNVIPAESRIWTPSLYMGVFPFLLALAAWSLRGDDVRIRWMSWTVLLAVLGSFGVYGGGWLYREIAVHWNEKLIASANSPVGDGFGGLYGWMNVVLPGYVGFRYPGKLLVLAGLGLSVLSAISFDSIANCQRTRRMFHRWLVGIGIISLAGIVAVVLIRPYWADWMAKVPANPLFGPLDPDGAWRDLLGAFVQTAVLCRIGWWFSRTVSSSNCRQWAMLLAFITAVDLAIANRWMVAAAPDGQWRQSSALAQTIRADADRDKTPLYRAARLFTQPPLHWQGTSSSSRQQEGMAWDRESLMPNYNLLESMPMLGANGTFSVKEYQTFSRLWMSANETTRKQCLDLLNVRYLLLPVGQRPPRISEWQLLDTGAFKDKREQVRIWVNAAAASRAWIVHRVDVLPPLTSRRPKEIQRRTKEVFFPNGKARNFRLTAALETDSPSAFFEQSPIYLGNANAVEITAENSAAGVSRERCEITHYSPQRVEIEVELETPGLVVLSDLYYPGWTVEVETLAEGKTRAVPILRTNRVMRGVALPAGPYRLVFRYRPMSVYWGAGVSAISWLGFLALGFAGWRRRKKQRLDTKSA